jgi:hypothetical protein
MKHSFLRACGAVLATAIVLASTAAAQTACKVVYTISPQNTSAFGATIAIQNTGTTAWASWTLTWAFANGQTVAQLWNGIETQSGANVTVKNEPYNGSVAAGGSVNGVGFNGTWNGVTNAVPTSFAINGTTCGATLTATTTTLAASTTTPAVGASVTLTATVAPTAATGTVTFYSGTTSLGTGTLSAGKATLTTSFATVGTYSLTAVYAGSTTYATSTSSAVSITVGTVKTATTTALAASTTTPAVGASVTLTATVAPSAATGTVTFYSGTTSLGTGTLSAGVATLTTSFATAGTYSLTAVYAGSTTYATSTSSAISITVGTVKTATTTALAASTTTPKVGASVTLTATVAPTAATGTVTFYSGTTSLGTGTLSAGKATLTTSFAAAGTYSLTAVYAGSTTYATSTSSAVSVTVTTTATTTALTVSTTTPKVGASVTLTATVTPTAATGTVTFYSGTTSLGTGTLSSGVATLTTSFAAAGTDSLTAVYGGSTTYTTSTSSAVSVTVSVPTGFTIAPSAATLSVTQGSTATDTITVTDSGGFTGSVTLSATGLPTGVTVTYGANPTTTASVLTFTATSTATLGLATVTITGTSGTTTATTTIALTVVAPGSVYAATAKANFLAMYGNMTAANGYFSPLGIPYHSVETFMVEAPDYGHETVSETYSYYLWLESMYGAVTGTWTPLQTAWNSMQTYMIPSAAQQPTNSGYNPSAPATYCPTYDSPSGYPCQFTTATVGIDPLSAELQTAYGTPNIYAMHWILDTTNWYGYGIDESGPGTAGAPSFYNSYQRGPQESVWLTIPQPSWDIFKYGNTSDGGYLSLFTGGTYTQQWKYTDAPDADARAIQALYWAQQYGAGNSTVTSLLPLGAELGDYLRYSFFDKYFKVQGCQSTSCAVENGSKNSSAYLLSWYYAWGGAVPADGSWAWRIGSSDVHFGYQNPLAAYALANDTSLTPKSPTAKADWTTTLQRTLEFYRWLQSSNGAIAGGATNSWGGGSNTDNTAWGGQYAVPPTGTPTFYGMSYIFAPSYGNPPSNQWFGMQAWSMERLAEYYYVSGNADAKIVLDPWMKWVEANSTATATTYSIPSSLSWSGQPSTDWNATTQDWTVGDLGVTYNSGLSVTITASGQDVGVTGSLCKALLYYSAGTLKWAGTQDLTSFNLAKQLLQTMWTLHRDSIGVSVAETRTDYSQLNIPIYVPSGWTGVMPNGDPINSSSTFLSIRTQYETDPNYAVVAAYAANPSTAPVPTFNYHRFWAQTDVATAYAVYYLLFPNN